MPWRNWIERDRPIDMRGAVVEVVNDKGERVTACRQSHRVIRSQIHRLSGKPRRFGCLRRAVNHPAVSLAHHKAPGRHAIGRGKPGIQLDRW